MMLRRPHCASLAPPVCLRSVCQVTHGHREETTRPPPADGLNGKRVRDISPPGSPGSLTQPLHSDRNATRSRRLNTIKLRHRQCGALTFFSAEGDKLLFFLLLLLVLQSFKTCPPFLSAVTVDLWKSRQSS